MRPRIIKKEREQTQITKISNKNEKLQSAPEKYKRS